jgi:thioredoxin 1
MGSLMIRYREAAVMIAVLPLAALLVGCGSTSTFFGTTMESPYDEDSAGFASLSGERRERETGTNALDESLRPDLTFVSSEGRLPTDSIGSEPESANNTEARSTISFALSDSQSTGTVEHVGTDDFQERVLQSNVPVLVDFYADWCGPCKKLAPALHRIARETPDAKVVKVNIDHSPRLAKKYGVRTIPTVVVFKNGEAVARNTGLANESTLVGLLDL